MKKWKVPKGCSFLEIHDNDDCIVFYYQNNYNPEDVKAYLIPKEKKAKEPVKTYEEGFIAGFSHNIKTVEELENKNKHLEEKIISVRKEAARLYKIIDKAIEYTKGLREKYFKECIAGSSIELGNLLEILKGE